MAALAQGCSGTIAQIRVEDGPVLTDTWFAAHGEDHVHPSALSSQKRSRNERMIFSEWTQSLFTGI